tara:strand:- start:1523 stop:1681 length:159 start_codon:yes stop_codon:yes gene_type:complete
MKFVINNKDNNNLAFYTYAVKKSYEKIPNEKMINKKTDNKTNDDIKKKKIIF